MRTSDSPFVIDWFVISLRWLVILGLVASLAAGRQGLVWPGFLLLGLAVWNVLLSAIAGTNRRLYRHREISLGVDALVAVLYFFFMGGAGFAAYLALMLPVFTATLYFEWRGTIISALSAAGIEIFYTTFRRPSASSLVYALAIAGALLLAAGLFGFASRGLLRDRKSTRLNSSH